MKALDYVKEIVSDDSVPRVRTMCESCEPTWQAMQVNMRVTQLLKANHFKMGA